MAGREERMGLLGWERRTWETEGEEGGGAMASGD